CRPPLREARRGAPITHRTTRCRQQSRSKRGTMLKGMIGRKLGMTQVFDENGNAVPCTVIEAGPCYVTQVRTQEKDGYTAVQLGFGETKPTRLTKGQLGHLKRNDLAALRYLREFRVRDGSPDVAE